MWSYWNPSKIFGAVELFISETLPNFLMFQCTMLFSYFSPLNEKVLLVFSREALLEVSVQSLYEGAYDERILIRNIWWVYYSMTNMFSSNVWQNMLLNVCFLFYKVLYRQDRDPWTVGSSLNTFISCIPLICGTTWGIL